MGRGTRGRLAATLIAGAACAGCLAHLPMNPHYSGPAPRPPELAQQYAYPEKAREHTETVLEARKDFTRRQVEIAGYSETEPGEHRIVVDYFDPPGPGPAPVVLMLPVMGGKYTLSERFATYFARRGYAAVIVHRQEQYKELVDPESIDAVLRQIVLDHKQVIDWVESRPELDPRRLGVFGVSMGGIKATLLAGLDARVQAAVIALAGEDLPYILAHSRDRGVRARIGAVMRTLGWGRRELRRELEARITVDPKDYARYIDASNTLLILARFDHVVPLKTGRALRRDIGNPETIYLLAGHYSSALHVPVIKRKAFQFFEQRFGT